MHEPVMGLMAPLVALASGAGAGVLIRMAFSARSGSVAHKGATERDRDQRAPAQGEDSPK